MLIIGLIIGGVFIFNDKGQQSGQPETVTGNETLEVIISNTNGNPITNVEVDLWKADKASEAPNAGITKTNNQGIATFKVPAGNYLAGFNGIDFPQEFFFPEKIPVEVKVGTNQQKITLEFK